MRKNLLILAPYSESLVCRFASYPKNYHALTKTLRTRFLPWHKIHSMSMRFRNIFILALTLLSPLTHAARENRAAELRIPLSKPAYEQIRKKFPLQKAVRLDTYLSLYQNGALDRETQKGKASSFKLRIMEHGNKRKLQFSRRRLEEHFSIGGVMVTYQETGTLELKEEYDELSLFSQRAKAQAKEFWRPEDTLCKHIASLNEEATEIEYFPGRSILAPKLREGAALFAYGLSKKVRQERIFKHNGITLEVVVGVTTPVYCQAKRCEPAYELEADSEKLLTPSERRSVMAALIEQLTDGRGLSREDLGEDSFDLFEAAKAWARGQPVCR